MVTLEERLENPDYKSWVKAALCVHVVKEGLENFAYDKSKELNRKVLSHTPKGHRICLAACTDPLKKLKTCCHNCKTCLTSLESCRVGTFTFSRDQFNNTEVGDWHQEPWQMAKLFMNRGQAKASVRPRETDLSGILNFIGRCSVPWNDVLNQANIDEVRKERNTILHTSSMLLTEADFLSKTDPMLDLLNDPKVLAADRAAQEAANRINTVRRNDFKINLDDETTAFKELADETHTLNAVLSTKVNELERNYICLKENWRKENVDQQAEIRSLKDGINEVKRLHEELAELYNSLQAGHMKDNHHLQKLLEQDNVKVGDELNNLNIRISKLENLESRVFCLETGVRENKLQINKLRVEICRSNSPCIQDQNTQSDDQDADQLTNHEIPVSVDEGDDVELALHLVRLIKWYPWLKSEMILTDARMIAKALLDKDSVRELLLEGRRRIAVDMLLKHVLRTETKMRFFDLLSEHWKPSDKIQEILGQLNPTEEDIEAYCHVKILDARQWHFQEDERKELRFTIKELTTLDTLNDWFLAKFFYSHIEHDVVIEKLLQNLGAGVDCLFDTMYKCDRKIVRCFCDTLESYCSDRSKVVTRLDLRKNYCDPPSEVKEDDTFLGALKCNVVRFITGSLEGLFHYFEQLEFNIDRAEEGSLVVYLSASTESAWKNLTRKCKSGEIVELLNTLDTDDQIWKTCFEKGDSIRMTIYSVKVKSARPKAVLLLELSSQDQSVRDGLGANPIKHNMDILCEELEICDSLIDELKKQELVRDDIRELLEKQHTRASEIRCLMENISPPKKGFKALLDYAKRCNTYLFDQLEISSEEYQNTKLFFTCEAKPTPRPAASFLTKLKKVAKRLMFRDFEDEESDLKWVGKRPQCYDVEHEESDLKRFGKPLQSYDAEHEESDLKRFGKPLQSYDAEHEESDLKRFGKPLQSYDAEHEESDLKRFGKPLQSYDAEHEESDLKRFGKPLQSYDAEHEVCSDVHRKVPEPYSFKLSIKETKIGIIPERKSVLARNPEPQDIATKFVAHPPKKKNIEALEELYKFSASVASEDISDMKVVSSRTVDVEVKDDGNRPWITGCVFLSTGQLVLCDWYNNKIRLMSSDLTVEGSLDLQERGPWDVSAVNSRTVIITLPYEKLLQYIELTPRLQPGRVIKLDKECWGVCVFGEEIYVTCYTFGEEGGEVRILDYSGLVKRRLGVPSHNLYMSRNPLYVSVSAVTGRIYFSDCYSDTLTCLSEDGSIIYQNRVPELGYPRGLYLDAADNVVVCGSGFNNLLIISPRGEMISTLLSEKDGIKRPYSVAYRSADKTLVVGCWDYKLHVFKLSH